MRGSLPVVVWESNASESGTRNLFLYVILFHAKLQDALLYVY